MPEDTRHLLVGPTATAEVYTHVAGSPYGRTWLELQRLGRTDAELRGALVHLRNSGLIRMRADRYCRTFGSPLADPAAVRAQDKAIGRR